MVGLREFDEMGCRRCFDGGSVESRCVLLCIRVSRLDTSEAGCPAERKKGVGRRKEEGG